MRRYLLCVASAALCAVVAVAAQQPLFRSTVDVLTVDVRVTDAQGRFVHGLTANDFRIFENDVAQDLLTFALVNIPFVAPTTATRFGDLVPRDVVTNTGIPSGRLYVLILDDVNSDPSWTPAMRALARRFVETHFAENDAMTIMPTSGRQAVVTPFLSDRRMLVDAIDRFEAGFGAAPIGTGKAMELLGRQIRRTLQAGPRRKSLILVSGATTSWVEEDPRSSQREPADALRAVITDAARANLSVYVIDPVGNPSQRARTDIIGAPVVTATGAGLEDVAVSSLPPPRAAENQRRWLIDRWQNTSEFAQLAEASGGFSLVNSSDFVGAFDRIVEENSTHYLLSYASTHHALDGKFRRIRVEVNRPGVTVKARSGYFATSAEPATPAPMSPQLSAMLRSPSPIPGMSLQLASPIFRGVGDEAYVDVIVEASGADLLFAEQDHHFVGGMQLAIAALGRTGIVNGERGDLSMSVSDVTYRTVMARGVRLLSRLRLKPGVYQIRVGATGGVDATRFGSVQETVTVPDFSRGAVTISSIAMRAPNTEDSPSRGTLPAWEGRLSGVPTLRRQFGRADTLEMYAEVYDNRPIAGSPVAIVMMVQGASGDVVLTRDHAIERAHASEKWVRYPVRVAIDAGALPIGDYVLTIAASHPTERTRPVRQRVPFQIR